MPWKEEFLSPKRLRTSTFDEKRGKGELGLDTRNPFESDYGRVLFSSASRRLHDKTQVFPLTTDDNIHSRLTHSLEVMGIGMSLAIYLCNNDTFKKKTNLKDVDIIRQVGSILKSSCLIHDIGNPPFGHFGEQIIQSYFKDLFNTLHCYLLNSDDCGCNEGTEDGAQREGRTQNCSMSLGEYIIYGLTEEQRAELSQFLNDERRKLDYTQFDGNAEGFRVVTKLQYIGDLCGLNLTSATLATTLKYPNVQTRVKNDPNIAKHKHGVFSTELEALKEVSNNCGLNYNEKEGCAQRHPFAFLMEAADSICYLIMDIEDANKKSWLSFDYLTNELSESSIADKINKIVGAKDVNEKKNLINIRNVILSHLMDLSIRNFIENFDDVSEGRYCEELIFDNDNVAKILQKIFLEKIKLNREIVSLEITGKAVITGILDEYIRLLFHAEKDFRVRAKSIISKTIFMTILHEHLLSERQDKKCDIKDLVIKQYEGFDVKDFSAEERFRLIRDFVVCMTDKFALNHFQKLSGQKI